MIITLKGADFSANNIGTLTTWNIFTSIGSGATYNGVNTVDRGAAFSATVTLTENYEVGSAGVTVTMGGTDITSTAVTTSGSTITISIASVTGTVYISVPTKNTATGEEDGGGNTGTQPVLYKTIPANGMFIMNYSGTFAIQSNSSSQTGEFQMVALDVSDYVGKNLKITATQAVIDGAKYSFFTNALVGGFELTNLHNISSSNLTETSSSGKKLTLDTSIIVEEFVVSTTSKVTNTITKTVPMGAKYLYLTNLTQEQTSEVDVTLA